MTGNDDGAKAFDVFTGGKGANGEAGSPSAETNRNTQSPGVKNPNPLPPFSAILHPDLVIRNKEETPNPEVLGLEEERPGWHGYVEWEKYPERKQKAKEFMQEFEFPGVCAIHVRFYGMVKLT